MQCLKPLLRWRRWRWRRCGLRERALQKSSKSPPKSPPKVLQGSSKSALRVFQKSSKGPPRTLEESSNKSPPKALAEPAKSPPRTLPQDSKSPPRALPDSFPSSPQLHSFAQFHTVSLHTHASTVHGSWVHHHHLPPQLYASRTAPLLHLSTRRLDRNAQHTTTHSHSHNHRNRAERSLTNDE